MDEIRYVKLRQQPALKARAAAWFHEKWGIPLQAYLQSMDECLRSEAPVPQWYLAMTGDTIVGGMGVIENDFHDRKDLRPNVCAVYVEPAYRCQAIAGRLLQVVCADMARQGIDTLYLLTDHTGFYERYGWQYYCPAMGDGEKVPSRIYIHESKTGKA